MQKIFTSVMDTPLGEISIGSTKNAICQISYGSESHLFNRLKLKEYEVQEGQTKVMQTLKSEFKRYFSGDLKEFTVPLELIGTDFQQSVWNALTTIPFGETRTYTQQTKVIGDLKAIRAVASANGKNPISIVVPCHRVIGSDGSLTGYAGGLDKKKWLLQHEGRYNGKGFQGEMF